MARYLAYQIKLGKIKYDTVISKFPQYKDKIDSILNTSTEGQ